MTLEVGFQTTYPKYIDYLSYNTLKDIEGKLPQNIRYWIKERDRITGTYRRICGYFGISPIRSIVTIHHIYPIQAWKAQGLPGTPHNPFNLITIPRQVHELIHPVPTIRSLGINLWNTDFDEYLLEEAQKATTNFFNSKYGWAAANYPFNEPLSCVIEVMTNPDFDSNMDTQVTELVQ